MHRFVVDPAWVSGGRARLPPRQARHLRVLRLEPGAEVILADGQGHDYRCRLRALGRGGADLEVLARLPASGEPPLEVILLQGLPKGAKLDEIVRRSVELGVAAVVPVLLERSVPGPRPGARRERWQRIAAEAARVARRARVPPVSEPVPLEEALSGLPAGTGLLAAWEEERERGLREAVEEVRGRGRLAVLIGPEGGLARGEVAAVRAHGGLTVALGPRILPAVSAGPAVLAVLLYALGDLGGPP